MTTYPKKSIHLIGIGGCGMAGLAEMLHQAGHDVSGSDIASTPVTERLSALGVTVYQGHSTAWVEGKDLIVISSAIDPQNPEVQQAQLNQTPVLHRAQMLAELINPHQSVVCVGSHGKTTTTSLLTAILLTAGLKPGFAIGATLAETNCNASLGAENLFVAEGDESDGSFQHFKPKVVILTNIDGDHLVNYQNSLEELKTTYVKWLNTLDKETLVIANQDDAHVADVLAQIPQSIRRYSLNEDSDYHVISCGVHGLQTQFSVKTPTDEADVSLNLPGQHNVSNAMAAITTARELGVAWSAIQQGLREFSGVSRRCQVHGDIDLNGKKITLIEDYGHHPVEVKATLEAISDAYPERRVVLAYQPHRYTRTQEQFDEFVTELSKADALVLCEIYAASEQPIEGVTSKALLEKIKPQNEKAYYAADLDGCHRALKTVVREGDVLILQGAGSITNLVGVLKPEEVVV